MRSSLRTANQLAAARPRGSPASPFSYICPDEGVRAPSERLRDGMCNACAEKKTRDTDVLVWYPSEKLKGKRIAVKDNFLLRGTPTTCSSRMLQGEPNRNDLAPSTILTVKKSCHRIRLSIYSDLGPTPLGLWSSDNSQNPDG